MLPSASVVLVARCQRRQNCMFPTVNRITIVLKLLPSASVVLVARCQRRQNCMFPVNRTALELLVGVGYNRLWRVLFSVNELSSDCFCRSIDRRVTGTNKGTNWAPLTWRHSHVQQSLIGRLNYWLLSFVMIRGSSNNNNNDNFFSAYSVINCPRRFTITCSAIQTYSNIYQQHAIKQHVQSKLHDPPTNAWWCREILSKSTENSTCTDYQSRLKVTAVT